MKYSLCLFVYSFGRFLRICVSGPGLGCSPPRSMSVWRSMMYVAILYMFGCLW